jgi:type I restriction enzyme S subunit
MERYAKYKDSGIAWLGKIPEHWEIKKLKQVAKLIDGDRGKNYPSENELISEGIPFLSTKNIKLNTFDFSREKKFISREKFADLGRGKIIENDLVVTMRGTIGQTALFAKVPYKTAFINAQMLIIRSLHIFPVFLKYVSNSSLWIQQLDFHSYGTAQQQLSNAVLGTLELFYPPLEEQKAIAAYLDRKTAEIDELIAQKERLIALYEEEKTAIINEAVTKGINPDVKLKPTAIDWLGDIPEHWKVTKANYVSNIFVPQRNKPQLNDTSGIPWLTMDDMSTDRISKTLFKVADKALQDAGSKVLPKGSVIASCVGNFGVSAINDIDVIINQQLQAFIPNNQKIISEYLCNIVSISSCYFEMVATAATLPYVNQSGFASIPILLPPLEEQKAIAEYIEKETVRIDAKIAKTKRIIELQKEYRTALISEAVTGKIKIPDLTELDQ